MNHLYVEPCEIFQFVQGGFTYFVIEGLLEVQGELPPEVSIDAPYATLEPKASKKRPEYLSYIGARLVICSLGLDTNTCGMLASFKRSSQEILKCEYENVVNPLGRDKRYARYSKISKELKDLDT